MSAKPVLVVMAAGMGSRYGGLKQLDALGPNGQTLMDYSLYDAWRAGFSKAVFVINEKMARDGFESAMRRRLAGRMQVRCAVQRLADVPSGFCAAPGREKPWGTAHAVWTCRELVDAPFAAVNADDYYGPESFRSICAFLGQAQAHAYCMVGYQLRKTLSSNGSVSRGVCDVDGDGFLRAVTERTHIIDSCDGALYTEDGEHYCRLAEGTLVSLNLWGFTLDFFAALEAAFEQFLRETAPQNPLKAEFYLPWVVSQLLARKEASVRVLPCQERWFGVTYAQDKPVVTAAIEEKTRSGLYPQHLWA